MSIIFKVKKQLEPLIFTFSPIEIFKIISCSTFIHSKTLCDSIDNCTLRMKLTCVSLVTKNAQCNQMICFPFSSLDVDFVFFSTLLNFREAYSYPKLSVILYYLGNYSFIPVFFPVVNCLT